MWSFEVHSVNFDEHRYLVANLSYHPRLQRVLLLLRKFFLNKECSWQSFIIGNGSAKVFDALDEKILKGCDILSP